MPFICMKNIELYYEIHGSGIPIIFLYGLAGSTQQWLPQIHDLKKKYCLILLDQRGQGRSSVPRDANDYDIHYYVTDILHLLNELNIQKAFIIGQSLGGGVAVRFAMCHPERILGLIVCNSHSASGLPSSELLKIVRKRSLEIFEQKGYFDMIEYIIENDPNNTSGYIDNPCLLKKIREQLSIMYSLVNPFSYRMTIYAMKRQDDISQVLHRIRLPVLLITGDFDPAKKSMLFLKDEIKTASISIFPNSGHYSNIDNPSEFNSIVTKFVNEIIGINKNV